MTGHNDRRGLTVWEILFAVFVLLFLVAVIVPALCRVRSVSRGPTCGVHLCGIGKAMLIYASDYDDRLPRAGGPNASWAARTPNWAAQDAAEAYGMSSESETGGRAGMSASLYLLVKYMEMTPREFLCRDEKGDIEKGASVFDPNDYGVHNRALSDVWDFGPNPPVHVSYAYYRAHGAVKLTLQGDSDLAMAADRNPWIDSPFNRAKDFSAFMPDRAPFTGTQETALRGNTWAHHGDGQNVLFLDCHVEFAKRAFCGVEDDNIYTSWDGDDKVRGRPAAFGSVPADVADSLLVSDPALAGQGD